MKHYLFFLGHPAHFHLFKHAINQLKSEGNRVSVVIKTKDILTQLLDNAGIEYLNLLPNGRKDGTFGIACAAWQKAFRLQRHCKQHKPDVMLGTSAEIAWVGKLLSIPSLVFNEDDVLIVKRFAQLVYPFATAIVSPEVCNNGKWDKKTIRYAGYQKLAYLHPNYFKPNSEIVKMYNPDLRPFSILRFAKLNAHHDKGAEGFNTQIARNAIKIMLQFGKVYITSERDLEAEFEPYRLNINPLHIHHMMFYAQLYIGDSQSMAVEAALLGTPSIRFSSFTGKISVLEELQTNYDLTKAISPNNVDEVYKSITYFLTNTNQVKSQLSINRQRMLSDKIDVTEFIVQVAKKHA